MHIHPVPLRVLGVGGICLAATLTALLPVTAQQEKPPVIAEDEQGLQTLTRGPLHEAFAQPVVFDPKPGVTAPKPPPNPIEEMPAEQKPEGENVAWIPGYWSWDEDRKDYIWLSGIWRVIPPGRQWVPGYWHKVEDGHQWVSGYWADADKKAVEYLPEPPDSLEVGPPSEAPSDDYLWSPGSWIWYDTRYVWRPGSWIVSRPGWTWYPSCYYWSPSGYIYSDGYWDYSFRRRGLCFAPIYCDPIVYSQPGFIYYPRVCLDVNLITDYFFCWPRYRHYCYGDYYGGNYFSFGIYPWFSFHYSRFGCSPTYSYYHWHYNRHGGLWDARLRDDYRFRRDNLAARPPRDLAAQRTLIANKPAAETLALAKPAEQLIKQGNLPIQVQNVALDRRKELRTQAGELQKFRDQRAKLEAGAAVERGSASKPILDRPGTGKPAPVGEPGKPTVRQPVKVELPKQSPIASRPVPGVERPKPPMQSDPTVKPRLGAGATPTPGSRPTPIRPQLETPRGDARARIEAKPEPPRAGQRPPIESRPPAARSEPPKTAPRPQIESRPAPRVESPRELPRIESRPAPRVESPRQAPRIESRPAPRVESPRQAPRIESRPAPRAEPPRQTPRIESRPRGEAPAIRSAPPAQSAPRMQSRPSVSAPRSAPSASPRSAPSAAPRSASPSRSGGSRSDKKGK